MWWKIREREAESGRREAPVGHSGEDLDTHPQPIRAAAARLPLTASRLFLTVFLIYAAHFASNVVRETYLAMSLGERMSVRVDEYLGLHPDLFEIPERGSYINNNPGASILGALPYAAARPAISCLLYTSPSPRDS